MIQIRQLRLGSVEADLEPLDLAEPALGHGLLDTFAEVVRDLNKAMPLGWINTQHGASNAGVFVLAGGAVGAAARAELELAELEVSLHLSNLILEPVGCADVGSCGSCLAPLLKTASQLGLLSRTPVRMARR